MKNIALLSLTLVGVVVLSSGCRRQNDDDDGEVLGTAEAQLVEDDGEAADTDDDLEAGLDEPLSGAQNDDPGNPAEAPSSEEVAEKGRANAGVFFKPAGCINSTREGNKVRHIFNKCRGPWDLAEFNGTINTTYERDGNKLTVTHTAEGFTANGASISGSRVVVYTREGTVITKTRTGNWSGTTAKGKEISHQANFVTSYDLATKCISRDGSATTTVGGRSLERTVDDFKRCGIGRGGCPVSGKITITRTKAESSLSLSIEFLGGRDFRVTRPNGKTLERQLLCRA